MKEKLIVEKNRMDSVLSSITDLVIYIGSDGRMLMSNHNAEKWLGVPEQEMRSSSYIDWLGNLNEKLALDIGQVFSNGLSIEEKDYELVRIVEDHKTTVGLANYSISPLTAQQGVHSETVVHGVVLTIQDMTPNKLLIKTLGAYVNPQVVDKILSDGGSKLGGIRCEAVCLFSDIRNFTTISESMEPTDVLDMLNSLFTLQVDAIQRFRGIIDKYIGDCIFAVFGVPIHDHFASLNACKAALGMRAGLMMFNKIQVAEGKVELKIGIGVNTGMVVSGNIGSEKRLEYTCIGDGKLIDCIMMRW